MNASSVISRARSILQDDLAPYRFTDAYMLQRFSDAQFNLANIRPDLVATTAFGATTITDVSSVSTASAFDETMRMPLAYLTAEQVYLTEDADAGNLAQAASMRSKFQQAMAGA